MGNQCAIGTVDVTRRLWTCPLSVNQPRLPNRDSIASYFDLKKG